MKYVSQKSATVEKRRIPLPVLGVDIYFCRNAQCAQFGIHPDPRDQRTVPKTSAGSNFPGGKVGGSGDGKRFTCGCCGQESVLKNNRAIVKDYTRLRHFQQHDGKGKSCRVETSLSLGKPIDKRPELYRKSGRTSAGHQRYACKGCGSTFTVGHPARNHRRQLKNGQVLKLLVYGTSPTKISEIEDMAPRDVYRKLDFIYERVREFIAEREGDLRHTDWEHYGRRFATDSQTLTLNWPNR